MGSFKVKLIKKFINNIDLAIETGTCFGNGTRQMARLFHKVITIELDETLHNETRQKLENEGYNNIQFLQGDSGVLIEHLSRQISKPALFYLDAHWSGDASVDWDNSEWKGYKTNTAHLGNGKTLPTAEQQVPLDREINAISNNFKNRGIIYIDDLDKFSIEGKGIMNKAFLGEDYSHLDLKNFRKNLGTEDYYYKDYASTEKYRRNLPRD